MIARREIETEGVGHKRYNFVIPTLKTRPPAEAPSSNPHSLHWDKRPIHTIKPKRGFNAVIAFKHTTVGSPRLCGNSRIPSSQKFWHEAFVLRSVMTVSVCFKPGSPRYQHGSLTQDTPKRINSPGKILPGEIAHEDARIVQTPGNGPVLELRLRRALIDVALGHEHWERDVAGADAAPGDVLRESLAPLSRLESRGVDGVNGGDVGEGDVGDVGVGGLVLAQRVDAHLMGLVADGAVLGARCASRIARRWHRHRCR